MNMARTHAEKSKRIEIRVTPEQKKRIERAAFLQGRSVTEFLVSSAQVTAAQVLQEEETLLLYERDAKQFVDALLAPSKPIKRAQMAARRYAARLGA